MRDEDFLCVHCRVGHRVDKPGEDRPTCFAPIPYVEGMDLLPLCVGYLACTRPEKKERTWTGMES